MATPEGLIRQLKSPNPEERRKAALALGRVRVKEAIEPLLQVVRKDSYNMARVAAIQSLTWIADPSVIPVFIDVMKEEEDLLVLRTLISALGSFKNTMAIMPLLEILGTNKDPTVVEATTDALYQIADLRALAELAKYLKSNNELVRSACEYALEYIAKQHGYTNMNELLQKHNTPTF